MPSSAPIRSRYRLSMFTHVATEHEGHRAFLGIQLLCYFNRVAENFTVYCYEANEFRKSVALLLVRSLLNKYQKYARLFLNLFQ
jgi:hypothetical protein